MTEARRSQILETIPRGLEGFHYPSPEDAIQKTLSLVQEATGDVVFFDIDDTLLISEPKLRAALNTYFAGIIPSFKGVTHAEVVQAGGRYYQVPAYQEAALMVGKDFYKIYIEQVAKNRDLHADMYPHKGALDLQKSLIEGDATVAGYPTARPHELSDVSAAVLKYFGFAKAPVIDVAADSGNPQNAKAVFFHDKILPVAQGKRIILIDEHVQTALAIRELCGDLVIPIVPIMARNAHETAVLQQQGILHGPLSKLSSLL